MAKGFPKKDKKEKGSKDGKDPKGPRSEKRATKGVKPTEAIARRASQMLAKPQRALTTGDVLDHLLKAFPAQDAEEWDRTGMLVGERALPVTKVALALDPTVSAIADAARAGANILITHHPIFLEPPTLFAPERSVAVANGAGVWAAIRNSVSVMSFHTALDVSRQAQVILANMLSIVPKKLLAPIEGSKTKGYGQICKVPDIDGSAPTLSQLAARCLTVFGRAPKVWGDASRSVRSAITFGGSASSFVSEIAGSGADAIICGEMKYHAALELKEAGIGVIELGHDVSEAPLIAILAKTVSDLGVADADIVMIDQSDNWTYPESIRL